MNTSQDGHCFFFHLKLLSTYRINLFQGDFANVFLDAVILPHVGMAAAQNKLRIKVNIIQALIKTAYDFYVEIFHYMIYEDLIAHSLTETFYVQLIMDTMTQMARSNIWLPLKSIF